MKKIEIMIKINNNENYNENIFHNANANDPSGIPGDKLIVTESLSNTAIVSLWRGVIKSLHLIHHQEGWLSEVFIGSENEAKSNLNVFGDVT